MSSASMPTCMADVLVIGGGASGSIAAIEASSHGARVVLANKGFLGRTGTTASTQGGLTAALAPPDDARQLTDDMLKCGRQLNDRVSVRRFADEVRKGEIFNLEKLGVTFDRDAKDNVRLLKVGGHSFPRMVMATWLSATTILRYGLIPQILRRGIQVADHVIVTKLLVEDGRVCGAVGLNVKSGKAELFRSKAVVLATGNAAQLFGEAAGASATGDGYSLAYQAGARLRDMEFVSCTIGFAHPAGLRGKVLGEPSTRPGTIPKLYNARHEAFLERQFPQATNGFTKDMYMLGISREIREGRGSSRDAVWYDFSNLDPLGPSYPFVTDVLGFLSESVSKSGVVECALAPYFFPGGVEYDENHQSAIRGLFVAGEAAGGLHGAERLASTAMAEAIVFGKRAGRYAATTARELDVAPVRWSHAVSEEKRLHGMLEQEGRQTPRELRRKLQATMWKRVGFIRNAANLAAAQDEIRQIGCDDLAHTQIRSKNPKANLEWVEQIENHFLVDVAQMLVAAALRREESRGSHFREDFPQPSADWVKKIVIDRDENGMRCRALDV